MTENLKKIQRKLSFEEECPYGCGLASVEYHIRKEGVVKYYVCCEEEVEIK